MTDLLPHRPPDRRDCGSWVAPDTGPDTDPDPPDGDCDSGAACEPADTDYDLPF